MQPGSIVVYLADPLLYGKLLVIGPHHDGRLLCEQVHADRRGEHAQDLFQAHEIETYDRWVTARVPA